MAFRTLRLGDDGVFTVIVSSADGVEPQEIRAPHAEDAYAGALLVHLTTMS